MKLFIKLMLALLVLAVLLPFTILKDQNGKTLMSFSDIGLPDFSMPSLSSNKVKSAVGGSKTDMFYQWQDADGTIQFTTEPPPEGVEYTIKKYNPDTNLIKAVSLPEEEEPVAEPGVASEGQQPKIQIGSPYSTEEVKKLIEDAQNIEKKLQQRYEDQASALN